MNDDQQHTKVKNFCVVVVMQKKYEVVAYEDEVCLPLLIFPCTMKSRSSLLAPAHPLGPGNRAVKQLWCISVGACVGAEEVQGVVVVVVVVAVPVTVAAAAAGSVQRVAVSSG